MINSGFNVFVNGIDVTPGIVAGWQTIDVSSYIPAGSSGVILELINGNSYWKGHQAAVREPGSTDDRSAMSAFGEGNSHIYALCGVIEGKFEAYISDALMGVYLMGYCDDAVKFFTNSLPAPSTADGIWESIDLSEVVSPIANGIIMEAVTKPVGMGGRAQIRKNGSTDSRTGASTIMVEGHAYLFCGLDENKVFQQCLSICDTYVVGYTEPPVVWLTNAIQVNPSVLGAWEAINARDIVGSIADGIILDIINRWPDNYRGAVRQRGSTDDRIANSKIMCNGHIGALTGLDSEQVFEAYKEHYRTDFWLTGYTQPVTLPLRHILTIKTIGQGTTNPASGVWEYEDGASVTVSAIPDAGWLFSHWEGDIAGTENPITFTITANMTITAIFTEVVPPPGEYAVTISVIGEGTTDPLPGAYTITEGTVLTITAYPAGNWAFDHWEGDVSGTMNPVDVEVLTDISVVAVFTEKPARPPWALPLGLGAGIAGLAALAFIIRRITRRQK